MAQRMGRASIVDLGLRPLNRFSPTPPRQLHDGGKTGRGFRSRATGFRGFRTNKGQLVLSLSGPWRACPLGPHLPLDTARPNPRAYAGMFPSKTAVGAQVQVPGCAEEEHWLGGLGSGRALLMAAAVGAVHLGKQ